MKFSGDRLRAIRGDQELAPTAVAAGVSVSTLTRWEAGTYCPDADQLALLAKHFGVPVAAFYAESVAS